MRDLVALGARVHVVTPHEETRAFALENGAVSAVAEVDGIARTVAGFVIATPTSTHAPIIETLLPIGRPIFVEKPLTTDIASARRIVTAAPDRVFVMDKWRYHPGIEALAAIAKSGELGRVLGLRCYRLGWGQPHHDVDAIWVLLPHDLAIVLEILGTLPAPHSAWAPVAGRSRCDLIALLADDTNAPQVTIEVGTSQALYRRTTVVIGDRKVVQLGGSYDDKLVIMEGTPDGESNGPYERAIGKEMPLLKELSAFLRHLCGGPSPRSSAADGLLIVERICALRALAGLGV
jgi:predicted dehydrogenase